MLNIVKWRFFSCHLWQWRNQLKWMRWTFSPDRKVGKKLLIISEKVGFFSFIHYDIRYVFSELARVYFVSIFNFLAFQCVRSNTQMLWYWLCAVFSIQVVQMYLDGLFIYFFESRFTLFLFLSFYFSFHLMAAALSLCPFVQNVNDVLHWCWTELKIVNSTAEVFSGSWSSFVFFVIFFFKNHKNMFVN